VRQYRIHKQRVKLGRLLCSTGIGCSSVCLTCRHRFEKCEECVYCWLPVQVPDDKHRTFIHDRPCLRCLIGVIAPGPGLYSYFSIRLFLPFRNSLLPGGHHILVTNISVILVDALLHISVFDSTFRPLARHPSASKLSSQFSSSHAPSYPQHQLSPSLALDLHQCTTDKCFRTQRPWVPTRPFKGIFQLAVYGTACQSCRTQDWDTYFAVLVPSPNLRVSLKMHSLKALGILCM
jgi:hypothetical protein